MTRPLRLILELQRHVEPPEGVLIDETGAERPFSGWMQLSSALSAACEHPAAPDGERATP